MGDRAVVVFKDGDEFSPVTYLHWAGDTVKERLLECFEIMRGRGADLAYTAARFTGVCHVACGGNLSLGCWNGPTESELYETELREDGSTRYRYTRGDAGVFVVKLKQGGWKIRQFGGYGFGSRDYDSAPETIAEWEW